MSANLYIIPTNKRFELPCATPSSFIEKMNKIFGCLPINLNVSSIEILNVMEAVSDDGEIAETISILIDLIEKFKSVTLEAEY